MAKPFAVNMSTKVPAGSYEGKIIRNGVRSDTALQFTDDTTGMEIDRDLSEMYGESVVCYQLTPVDRPSDTVTISREDFTFLMSTASELAYPDSAQEVIPERMNTLRNRLNAVKVLGTRSNG